MSKELHPQQTEGKLEFINEDVGGDEQGVEGIDVLPNEIESSLGDDSQDLEINYMVDLASLLLNAFKFKASNEVIALLNSKDWRNPDKYPPYKKLAWIRNLLERNKEDIIQESEISIEEEGGNPASKFEEGVSSIKEYYGLVEESKYGELLDRIRLDKTRLLSQTKEDFYNDASGFNNSSKNDQYEVSNGDMNRLFHVAKILSRLIGYYESTLVIYNRTPKAFERSDGSKQLNGVVKTYEILTDYISNLAKSLPDVKVMDASSGRSVDPFDSIKRTFTGGSGIEVYQSLKDIYDILTSVFPNRSDEIKTNLIGIKEIIDDLS